MAFSEPPCLDVRKSAGKDQRERNCAEMPPPLPLLMVGQSKRLCSEAALATSTAEVAKHRLAVLFKAGSISPGGCQEPLSAAQR